MNQRVRTQAPVEKTKADASEIGYDQQMSLKSWHFVLL
jgi:hypothetical protein